MQDFGQLGPHDMVSDSEDDDGQRYHWESHYQQMVSLSHAHNKSPNADVITYSKRLADQPDIDTK